MSSTDEFNRQSQKSLFAEALRSLLDDTYFYSRKDWAYFFSVSEEAISSWVNDQIIPRPDRLSMLLDLLNSRGKVREPIEKFNEISQLPATEVSPFGFMMLPKVADYICRKDSLIEFAKSLRDCSPEQQEWAIHNT